MASPGAIIRHGSTPTGFGIRQRSNGNLRATSACCGRTMSGNSGMAFCNGCNTEYDPKDVHGAAMFGDVPPTNGFVDLWVANITGLTEVAVIVL